MPPNTQDFQNTLDRILRSAQELGACFIGIKSGDLHQLVGGYPSDDHRIPVCCDVMKERRGSGDEIIEEPPSGQGATLVIQYQLPR